MKMSGAHHVPASDLPWALNTGPRGYIEYPGWASFYLPTRTIWPFCT